MLDFTKLWKLVVRPTCASLNQKETTAATLPEPATQPRIADLVDRFDQYAKGHYSRAGKPTDRYLKYRAAMRFLAPLHGLATNEFKAQHLRQTQQRMTESKPKLCRDTINIYTSAIKTAFQWGTENGNLVPASTYAELLAVKGLKKSDGRAKQSRGVNAIKDSDFAAVVAKIKEPHKTILQLQHLTCARPGEIVKLRPCEIDRNKEVWVYSPAEHKTSYVGMDRNILLNTEAQELLKPFEPADANDFYFAHDGAPYTVDALRTAIRRVCRKHGLTLFKPNQVRHTAATKVRDVDGIEAAQAMLGHSKITTTQIYAKANLNRGMDTAKKGTLSLKSQSQASATAQATLTLTQKSPQMAA